MSRLTKQCVTAVSCALILCLGTALAHGDATTTPATGSITGTVTGVNGPTSGATIKVFAFRGRGKKAQGASTTGKRQRPVAVGQATTDANGNFTILNIPDGNYIVIAVLKGVGVGHAKANLSGSTVSVSITLNNHRAKSSKKLGT